MPTNDFLPFATAVDADVQSQADFASATSTTKGFANGIAEPAELNKVWRQSSFIAAGVAAWLAAQGVDVPDDGDIATFTSHLIANLVSTKSVVGSVAAIRALDSTKYSHAFATGYRNPGDGGSGNFYVDSADTTSLDNGFTIIVGADNARWKLVDSKKLSVKQAGCKGDGSIGDRAFAQAAITWLEGLGGGRLYYPNGTYESVLSVTQAGIYIECESDTGVIFQVTSGTAGNFAITVDLSGGGVAKPLSFGMDSCTIQGDSDASRQYNGIMLYNVYKPDIGNIRFKALGQPIVGRGCFWGRFYNMWFEHYTTGISGYSAAYGLNSCTFTNMNFFEGNVDHTAKPQDGTYMNNNTWTCCSFSAADPTNSISTMITGVGDTYDGCRFESINASGHWVTVTRDVTIRNPSISSQVALAAGKYVFDVTGYDNTIECDLMTFNRVVRLETQTRGNYIIVKNNVPVSGAQHILDLGIGNRISYGNRDHCAGSSVSSSAFTWSDILIRNLITKSINQGNIVCDGLVARGLQVGEIGPDERGGCYLYDTPTGNRQLSQSIGAVGINESYAGSFWIKAVSGGEQTINACVSENPAADYATSPITITSNQWIRVPILRKFTTAGIANAYLAIQLPVAHPGILLKGPQMIYLGTDASPGENQPFIVGGYVPTHATIRAAIPNKDSHKFQIGVPTSGHWSLGDEYIDLSCVAGATSPGGHCITGTGADAGAWKALPNLAA